MKLKRQYERDDTVGMSLEESPWTKIAIASATIAAGTLAYKSGLLKQGVKMFVDNAGKMTGKASDLTTITKNWINSTELNSKFSDSLVRNTGLISYDSLFSKKGMGALRDYSKRLLNKESRDGILKQTTEDFSYLSRNLKERAKTLDALKTGKISEDSGATMLMRLKNRVKDNQADFDRYVSPEAGKAAGVQSATDMYNKMVLSEEKRAKQLKRTGYRSATISDFFMIEKTNEGTVILPKESSKKFSEDFMKEVVELGNMEIRGSNGKHLKLLEAANFKEMVIDEGIMIGKNGNISDLRHLNNAFKSTVEMAASQFQIPVIGINPLRLFGLDNIKKTVDDFGTFLPGTHQGAINASKELSTKPYLLSAGSVFEIGTDGVMNKIKSNVSAERIYRDSKMSSRQAEAYLKLAGVRKSDIEEYTKEDGVFNYLKGKTGKFLDLGRSDRSNFSHRDLGLGDKLNPNEYIKKMTNWLFDGTEKRRGLASTVKSMEKNKGFNYQHFGDIDFNTTEAAERITDATARLLDSGGVPLLVAKNNAIKITDALLQRNDATLGKFAGQFFAGRKNLDQVTTATLNLFHVTDRINSTLNIAHLGLSVDSMSSSQAILGNLILKRALPVVAGYNAFEYLNYLTEDEETGDNVSKKVARGIVNTKLTVFRAKDALGITDIAKKITELTPGSDHITELPGINALDLEKTEEEMRDYYENGYDPIRKGRYWDMGVQAFTGSKISWYRPNWYRRVEADVKFSDSMHGSREEYFKNAPLPTPSHLFAPVRHFITDPYHWEKKHYHDRPYPVTAPAFANVPVVGPLLGSTIGRVIKPQIKMHREEMNANRSVQGGSSVYMMPTGNADLDQANQVLSQGDSSGLYSSGGARPALYTTASGKISVVGLGQDVNAAEVRGVLKNRGIGSAVGVTERLDVNTGVSEAPDEEYVDMNGISTSLGDTYNNLTDFLGIYGYASRTATGRANQGTIRMETSSYATSMGKIFWDQEIGGLGGEINEIFRRFIPKRGPDDSYYNPIRNTQGDWMPGCFIEDTNVYTDKGFTAIQDIAIGDRVISHDGSIQDVEYVNKAEYKGDFITIKGNGLPEEITSTGNHPFYIIKSNECHYFKKKKRMCIPGIHPSDSKPCRYCKAPQYSDFSWTEARDISYGDYLAIPIPTRGDVIEKITIPKSQRKMCKDISEKEIPLSFDFGVFIGFYLSEGFSDKYCVYLGSGQEEQGQRNSVDTLCEKLNINFMHKDTYNEKSQGCVTTQIHNAQLARWLTANFGNKAVSKNIPEWVYSAPEEFQMGLVAGYIEGDGSVSGKQGLTASSVSQSLVHALILLLAQNGILSNMNSKTNGNHYSDKKAYILNISQKQAVIIKKKTNAYGRKIAQIPDVAPGCTGNSSVIYKGYLLRKVEKVWSWTDTRDVYNLQVAENHTFNAEGVAVHNSNYFIDFKHGDPYVKVKAGEERLAGEGYERLHGIDIYNMRIGSSSLGKTKDEIIDHYLKRDPILEGTLSDEVTKAGDKIHKQIEKDWLNSGYAIEVEGKIEDTENNIIGYYDARVHDPSAPGQQAIIDIKTVSDKIFSEIKKDGIREDHKRQVNYYLWALGLQRGGVYYVNRDTGETLDLKFDFDKDAFNSSMRNVYDARAEIMRGIENGNVSRGDLYSHVDRLRILADVAPYSNEYREMAAIVSRSRLSEEEEEEVRQIRERVSNQKKPLRTYDYKFSTADIVKEHVNVSRMYDYNTIYLREYDAPLRMAGITVRSGDTEEEKEKIAQYMEDVFGVGDNLTIGVDKASNLQKKAGSIRAVVYKNGRNINKELIDLGYAKVNENDEGAAAIHGRYNIGERLFGSIWEKFAHLDTPFHTKFLKVRSPFENYERERVYGKEFTEWHDPYEDFLKPMVFDRNVNRGTVTGIVWGAIVGSMFGTKRFGRTVGALIGAGAVAAGKVYKEGYEAVTDSKWKPKRIRQENEIHEYMDMLKYIKSKKLYNEYADRALREDHVDVRKLIGAKRSQGKGRKNDQYELQEIKQNVKRSGTFIGSIKSILGGNFEAIVNPLGDEKEELRKINAKISEKQGHRELLTSFKRGLKSPSWEEIDKIQALQVLQSDVLKYEPGTGDIELRLAEYGVRGVRARDLKNFNANRIAAKVQEEINRIAEKSGLTDNVIKAIQYYNESEQTMYGYDKGDPITNLLAAMPKKDRDYFNLFVNAPEEERMKILELVPKYMRRPLMVSWGMKPEAKPSLLAYFKNHALPDADWRGWDEDVSLNAVRVKMFKKADLDFSDVNVWQDDIDEANRVGKIDIPKLDVRSNSHLIRSDLYDILGKQGVKDLRIESYYSNTDSDINLDLTYDSRARISQEMEKYERDLIG